MNAGIKISLAGALLSLAAGVCCGYAAAQDAAPNVIVLPARVVAGEPATLAVLDSAGRLATGATVEIVGRGEKITTDATGRATFTAPAQGGAAMSAGGVASSGAAEAATLRVRLQSGEEFTAPVIPAPASSLPVTAGGNAKTAGTAGIGFPATVALGDRFAISGSGFRGDANLDHVFLGNDEALVLAASPVEMVVLPNSHTMPGSTRLILQVNGLRQAQEAITVVSLAVTGPAKALAMGEKGLVTVEVSGTTRRLNVEVHNLSPGVVRLMPGDTVQVTTNGQSPNVARVEIVGVSTGDYSITARLSPGVTTAAASR
jgi:hypothetical protein